MTLREWLFKQRMSVAEFARRLGISRPYLVTIKSGTRKPSKGLFKLICLATDGEIKNREDLLDGK